MMPSRNKRQYARVDVHGFDLEFSPLKRNEFSRALLVNLSECGALILSPSLLQARDFLSIRIHGVSDHGPIVCKARVVHLAGERVHPMHFYAGLRFQDLLEADKAALRRFIVHRQNPVERIA